MARVWSAAVGCKVSRADAEVLRERAVAAGHDAADDVESADVAVLTTCCVTAEAERSSRQRVRRLAGRGLPVVVTGCAATYRPEQFEGPCVTVVEKAEVGAAIDRLAGSGPCGRDRPADRQPTSGSPKAGVGRLTGNAEQAPPQAGPLGRRTRAVLKIQDGCLGECSYCAVRLVRGPLWSLSTAQTLAAARHAVDAGCGELVVSGINLGLYGRGRRTPGHTEGASPSGDGDLQSDELAALVERLAELPGLERLRLSSVEPLHVTDRLLKALSHPRVARHLHLPLQSADDGVLRDMRRPYTYGEYLDRLDAVRDALPGIMVSTDVIVGFPTESSGAFEKTLAAIDEDGHFGRVHVFTFSPRAGTAAADMMPLPVDELRRRRRAATQAASRSREAAARRLLGREVDVLAEQRRDGLWSGYSSEYVRCRVAGRAVRGRMVRATAVRTTAEGLECETAQEPSGADETTRRESRREDVER